jgi:hypothetical protein
MFYYIMNYYIADGLSSIDRKLNEIEMDLLSYQLQMTTLNSPVMDVNTAPLIDALNHLYIFEDEHKSLYKREPECDVYEELCEAIDEYMAETKMTMWRDPEYLDIIYEWFMEAVVPYLQSMDPDYTFFADMSYKKHAEIAHTAFLVCFVKWMRTNNIDFRSIGVPDKMTHYEGLKREEIDDIGRKIGIMDEKNAECAIQGTEEWLKERREVITASVAWKAMDSEANRRSLINEKITEPAGYNSRYISLDKMNPLQKGHCYEPISVMLYEHIFKTKVADYGCLRHSKYSFLGASPDGLNIDETSPKYGRLLEIKNVTSRGLTGFPKKEYWVQMQIQMEVCDLNECDFFECDFKEYDDEEAYMKDGDEKTKKGQWKGCYAIVCVGDDYQYKYCPIGDNIGEWLVELKENDGWEYIKHRYWWLDSFSCVLVPRNHKWFELNVGEFERIWAEIEKNKETGVKPVKRVKVVKKDVCMIDMSNMGEY